MDRFDSSLASTLQSARGERGWSAADLAEQSGVSRAMIGKIERGQAQPTAALLGRLSAALGMTLSELVARAEGGERRLARRAEQRVWTDPDSGYVRRAVSPSAGGAIELVEVELPTGALIAYPAGSYAFLHHQIWVLRGRLRFHEGTAVHDLGVGDCLQLGPPADCAYENVSKHSCRYLVALSRR